MNNTLSENAKILNISKSFLSDILNGKKGCNEELMLKIKEIYNIEFEVFNPNPRYRIKKKVWR